MLFKAAYYLHNRKKLDNLAKNGQLYQILVEKDAQFKPSQYNNFFDSLYSLYSPKNPSNWLTFEFHGTPKGIYLYTWLPGSISSNFVQSNINSVHKLAEVIHAKNDYAHFSTTDTACATLELDSHYLFNLAQSDGDRSGADVMASMCASMHGLSDNEEVAIQFLLRPVHFRTLNIASSHFEVYKAWGKRPSKLYYPYAPLNPYLEVPKAIIDSLRHTLIGAAGKRDHNTSLLSIQKKLEAGIYFDLLVRIVTVGKQPAERLATVISAFAPVTDKNRLRPYTNYKNKRHKKFLAAYKNRRIHTYPLENYVTPAELATLIHFPSRDIPGVIRLRSKKLPVPDGVIKYNTIKDAWDDGAIVFGISNYRGTHKYLAFKDIRMLMQHAYIIGATGSGKSYLLLFIALQISLHTGLTFFDVKGDVVDLFLEYLPENEWNRVVYIDLHDSMWFIPFNMLRQDNMTVYNLASLIVDIFVKLFSEGSIKEHSQNVLRQALIAVISTDPRGSILEVYRMFTDESYLDLTIGRLEAANEYPDVLNYWKNVYKHMRASGRKNEAGAITNKLQKITQNERPRYTLCQQDNVLKWRNLLDGKAIVLVNLSLGQNDEQILSFFGSLFTAFISQATFSRDDIREEDRIPHLFILDEFERFIDNEADLSKFLEMSRSYGLGLILAHQSVKQIPEKLLGIVEDNTFSQISLNIGTASNAKIARMFPGSDPEDFINLDVQQGYARFKKLHPDIFTFDTLDIKEYFKSSGYDKVEQFKMNYKRKHYKHLNTIKSEINNRYSLIEKNQLTDDEIPVTHRGNASGKIKRGT